MPEFLPNAGVKIDSKGVQAAGKRTGFHRRAAIEEPRPRPIDLGIFLEFFGRGVENTRRIVRYGKSVFP